MPIANEDLQRLEDNLKEHLDAKMQAVGVRLDDILLRIVRETDIADGIHFNLNQELKSLRETIHGNGKAGVLTRISNVEKAVIVGGPALLMLTSAIVGKVFHFF